MATPQTITTDVLIQGEPTLGRADAPVTILEFSDFECPYCQQFHDEVMGTLRHNYIETGLVRFVHKDLPPFHGNAVKQPLLPVVQEIKPSTGRCIPLCSRTNHAWTAKECWKFAEHCGRHNITPSLHNDQKP